MKIQIIIILTMLTTCLFAQPEWIERLAKKEGINPEKLWQHRIKTVKQTKNGPIDHPYSYFNVPVSSKHSTDIEFKSIKIDSVGIIRFYESVGDMYKDACKYFYSIDRFTIPDHPNSDGGPLKFKPNNPTEVLEGGNEMDNTIGSEVIKYRISRKQEAQNTVHQVSREYFDQIDLIKRYCELKMQYIKENQGRRGIAIASVLNDMEDFVKEMKYELHVMFEKESKIVLP